MANNMLHLVFLDDGLLASIVIYVGLLQCAQLVHNALSLVGGTDDAQHPLIYQFGQFKGALRLDIVITWVRRLASTVELLNSVKVALKERAYTIGIYNHHRTWYLFPYHHLLSRLSPALHR